MSKSTRTYWNPLGADQAHHWRWVEGLEGQVQELILSEDPATGEITRLTRFLPGADTAAFGGKAHDFPEEIFIVSGRLYDEAFAIWLEPGHYASRPPGEQHGPFRSDEGCLVLDVSFPQRGGEGSS
ncbi:cupin domain-containing protein [Synechococcus sp. Tobar12-5m-g]|uniref:cupin domain-containing protein n=1 Tax=unclassified Synechococcus TaxID=2626047 RepID=UPI0020CE9C31|nr:MULTISPECIES: cupin domain-containing protein [unclassified Synechococcus]MCP9773704.1 cupin domain-containing protein [Synechococcus sp. Tobar12-5m-g]MCP9874684.1 cupin domain-containing protein [Synechococcus sp. Cruz CV-v-12]